MTFLEASLRRKQKRERLKAQFKSSHFSSFDMKDKNKKKLQSVSKSSWHFPVDYNDHFETPFEAYEDIDNILQNISQSLGKEKKDLIIYDPYYCKGQMVIYLNGLGYETVINRNADFYSDMETNNIPGNNLLNKITSIDNSLLLYNRLRCAYHESAVFWRA